MCSSDLVIGGAKDDKASILVSVSQDLTARIKAGDLVGELAKRVGGKGGGKPDSAQGGGPDIGAIDSALAAAPSLIAGR